MPEPTLDRRALRRSFERAAPAYEHAAVVQREVAERLLERLSYIRLQPRRAVDLGSGTGLVTRALRTRYRRAHVVALDLALAMLHQGRCAGPRLFSRTSYLCGDAARLPLADHSVDLLVSNLTLQWCPDLAAVASELSRVLAPGGLLLLSTLGPDTLWELRASWEAVDARPHVNEFADMHVVGDALVASGLRDVVMDVDRIVRLVPDVHTLMRQLKAIGAHNIHPRRARALTGKRRIQSLERAYETHRRADRQLPATYEVVYAHAWAAEAPGTHPVALQTYTRDRQY